MPKSFYEDFFKKQKNNVSHTEEILSTPSKKIKEEAKNISVSKSSQVQDDISLASIYSTEKKENKTPEFETPKVHSFTQTNTDEHGNKTVGIKFPVVDDKETKANEKVWKISDTETR